MLDHATGIYLFMEHLLDRIMDPAELVAEFFLNYQPAYSLFTHVATVAGSSLATLILTVFSSCQQVPSMTKTIQK